MTGPISDVQAILVSSQGDINILCGAGWWVIQYRFGGGHSVRISRSVRWIHPPCPQCRSLPHLSTLLSRTNPPWRCFCLAHTRRRHRQQSSSTTINVDPGLHGYCPITSSHDYAQFGTPHYKCSLFRMFFLWVHLLPADVSRHFTN